MLKNDWLHPFSMEKETAEWLKTEFPDRAFEKFVFIGMGTTASTLCGYLNDMPVFFVQERDYGTYATWRIPSHATKANQHNLIPDLMNREQKDAILIFPIPFPENGLPPNMRLMKSFTGAIKEDENFYLYLRNR